MSAIHCTAMDLWRLAQTAWGEARGEGVAGLMAVCWVVRNRHDIHPHWRGLSIEKICLAYEQFSCWNLGDPNRPKMDMVSVDDGVFVYALTAALDVLAGEAASPVGLATHYYVDGTQEPAWAGGHTPAFHLGHHLFFEGIA